MRATAFISTKSFAKDARQMFDCREHSGRLVQTLAGNLRCVRPATLAGDERRVMSLIKLMLIRMNISLAGSKIIIVGSNLIICELFCVGFLGVSIQLIVVGLKIVLRRGHI